MADTVAIQIPRPKVKEGSAFTATAYFRSAGAAALPTNVKYRIDNLTSGDAVADWTTVSTAANVSISITSTHNAIRHSDNRYEKVQLTVAADHGLSSQVMESTQWEVRNIRSV